MYFFSASVILLASLASVVQVSLPYIKTGRAADGWYREIKANFQRSTWERKEEEEDQDLDGGKILRRGESRIGGGEVWVGECPLATAGPDV